MKKTLLLSILLLLLLKGASAQLHLTGTSYYQDFNSLGNGLPTGWSVRDSASGSYLGNDTTFYAYPSWWLYTSGCFRNYASGNNIVYFGQSESGSLLAEDSDWQATDTDRALGVRQVSPSSTHFPGSDPGAAFVLEIANTTGLSNFNLSFELQSLDSLQSSRITTWYVDYGFGTNPDTFTVANLNGNNTTGGNTFTNTILTIPFGNALDNQAGPVWIRIIALIPSIQTEDRATSAIDNYSLTWTGLAGINNVRADNIPLQVTGTTSHSISVDFSLSQSPSVTAVVYDITGREICSGKYPTVSGANHISINSAEALSAGMYFVRISDDKNNGVAKAIITH